MVFLPCLLPLLFLPLLVGGYLFGRSAASPLTYFIALMTLKPLLATPLWLVMIQLSVTPSWTHPIPDVVLHALPGISLTLLIVWTCRARLKGQSAGIITTLLILDTIRWGSSVLSQTRNRPYGSELLFVLSVSMPSVFAIVAWLIDKRLARTDANTETVSPE